LSNKETTRDENNASSDDAQTRVVATSAARHGGWFSKGFSHDLQQQLNE
jgi:hypothetical protein